MKFYSLILFLIFFNSVILAEQYTSDNLIVNPNQLSSDLNPIPYLVVKYLDEHYKNYLIVDSKKTEDGNQMLRIKCDYNKRRSYYKDLVFDSYGRLVQ